MRVVLSAPCAASALFRTLSGSPSYNAITAGPEVSSFDAALAFTFFFPTLFVCGSADLVCENRQTPQAFFFPNLST